MFPTDPINMAKHIRLMTELKELYIQGVINSDLKKAIRQRLTQIMSRLFGNRELLATNQIRSNYFSPKRIAVYTSIYGPIDEIHEPLTTPDNCDFYIFTDQSVDRSSSWIKMPENLIPPEVSSSNVLKNRYVKMFPDRFFAEYDFTIYIDGKFQIRTDVTEYIQEMNPYGIKMFKHPLRTCTYQEIEACIKLQKGSKTELLAYRKRLRSLGMPQGYGLLEGAIIIREANHPVCQRIMAEWWSEFTEHVKRDQISLPFVLWKSKIAIDQIGQLGDNIWKNPAFRKYPHSKNRGST